MSGSLPLIMTAAGPQPTPATTLRQQLDASVSATDPGYTSQLPGSAIEDIASTDVGALAMLDQARVDAINSVSPFGANPFILNMLGVQFGIPQGLPTNTSVYVVFSGSVGFLVAAGTLVSDGTNQYAVQDGGEIQSTGSSNPLFAVATQSGSWPVPAASVNEVISSIPEGYTLTVTNPNAGTAGTSAETVESYRSRVLQAGQVAALSTPAYLKTLLAAIPNVSPRLISVRQVTAGWEVICGGADANAVARAIYLAVPDLSRIVGSTMAIQAITKANPGVVTTTLNHGYLTGQVVTFSGIQGMTELNTGNYTITVITETTFSIGVDTSAFTTYSGGGQVLPNLRNVTASVIDPPDSYSVTFVNPPQQVVAISATWNTTLTNFLSGPIVNQQAAPALAGYINGIPVGQPINLMEMTATFRAAVASVLSAQNLTTLLFTITINGIATSPTAGTSIIPGDPESYFQCLVSAVTVTQG